MSEFLLGIHIVGALGALCVAVLAIRSTFVQEARATFYAQLLSVVFIVDVLSGVFLAIRTATPVISVCDNLALYAVLFALVQGFLSWKEKISFSPAALGIGIPGAFTFLALVSGF